MDYFPTEEIDVFPPDVAEQAGEDERNFERREDEKTKLSQEYF